MRAEWCSPAWFTQTGNGHKIATPLNQTTRSSRLWSNIPNPRPSPKLFQRASFFRWPMRQNTITTTAMKNTQ